MFDATPPNLPVAPAPSGAGQVPTVPSAPVPQSPPVPPSVPPPPVGPMPPRPAGPMPHPSLTTSSKREPEDIFAGMEKAARSSSVSGPAMPEPRGSRFPARIILIGLAALFVLGILVFTLWKFVAEPKKKLVTNVRSTPAKEVKQVVVEEPLPVPESPRVPVTTPPPGIPIPAPAPQVVLVPPPVSPSEGVDTDADGLTDAEEPFYDADPSKSDTDGDGYPDGKEVRNLFDLSKKGGNLADAKFISRLFGKDVGMPVSLLAPKPWSLVVVPTNEIRAALSTGSATRFVFEWKQNREHASIDAWIVQQGISTFPALHSIKTKGGIEGRQTSDGLTTYLPLADSVLIVTYDLNGDSSDEYRTSYEMVIQSITGTSK